METVHGALLSFTYLESMTEVVLSTGWADASATTLRGDRGWN
jgi:hypothetical protein